MLKLWNALFGARTDPSERQFDRRTKLNLFQNRFSLEVQKQNRFLKEYLSQAAEAKRTGDVVTLASIKKTILFTAAMRRRAQRMLNAVRLVATKTEQMEDYKAFCGILSEVSLSLDNTLSSAEVIKAQASLQLGLQKAQVADQMLDQMLDVFDGAFNEPEAVVEETASQTNASSIDTLISQFAEKKETATEKHIEELLAAL